MKYFNKVFIIMCCFIITVGSLTALAISYSPENDLFFICSVSDKSLTWDLSSFHRGEEIGLWTEDFGPDRFIKIIPHASQSEYVFFQPQSSLFVADITGGVGTPGAELQIWGKGENNQAQMFKMIEVTGENDTYYIQNASSGLYLTAHGKGHNITQEEFYESDDNVTADQQKWYFKKMDGATMEQPSSQYVYALENMMAENFIDIPGSAPNQGTQDAELQLWNIYDMSYAADRYVEIWHPDGEDEYFYIHPLHSTEVWDVEGGGTDNGTVVQLWPRNDTSSQQFKFEYAGEPNTYFIKSRVNQKYVDAGRGSIEENGCKIKTYSKNSESQQENQKWKLHMYKKYQMPPEDQAFYIKAAYSNKYWDLGGNPTNQKGNEFKMWSLDDGGDRKYKFIPTGDGSWVNIQVQNGARHVDIQGGTTEAGAKLHLWDPHGGDSQKFAILFTSPTTFVLRTKCYKAVDISGGDDVNGANLIQYDAHFRRNQQFQLVYADGPYKGKTYQFDEIDLGRDLAVEKKNEAELELVKKFAPQLRFHPNEISYTSPVEGIVNRAYKVKPLSPYHFTELTTGLRPEIAMNDINIVLEIHHTSAEKWNPFANHDIHYRVGTLNDNGTIDFTGHRDLTTGINPSIAINNNNYVVEAHRHNSNDGIDLRYGKLNTSDKTIDFAYVGNLANGENPSVALNDDNIFIMVNESEKQLEYHYGLVGNGNITFYGSEIIPYHGIRPSVALNNAGHVVLTYEHNDKIFYLIGQFDENKRKPVVFTKPIYLTSGNNSSIELNDAGDILEIHQTSGLWYRKNPNGDKGLYTMIHYRYGELQMNYGVGDPYIEFSTFIELCSGETPEIALNNLRDVVEIHQTDSEFNADLHYRVSNYERLTITSLNDLQPYERGYILVQKGTQSWEAFERNYKIYTTIRNVNNNIEIGYHFFYPKNGANILGTDFMEHIGDWERIYVTVDAEGKRVLRCRYHHHAESTDLPAEEYDFVGGTHPIVYSACETHASYPSTGYVGFHGTDVVSSKGYHWDSWSNLEIAKSYGEIRNNNYWILWDGLWGSTLNSPDCKI